jgi:threonine dehydrogenase-like Zn-dependent dehydrogenase
LAEAIGVEHFIVNDSDSIRTITDLFGSLPDIVVECVGLPGTIERSIELVRPRGTVIVAGAVSRLTAVYQPTLKSRCAFSVVCH